MDLSLNVTVAILLIAVVIAGIANYQARKPAEPERVRWVPYVGVQFLAILIMVLMLAHLVSLVTGQPLVGRLSR